MIRLVRIRDPWGVAPPPACKSNDWAALAKSEQDKERLRPTEQGEFWLVPSQLHETIRLPESLKHSFMLQTALRLI